MENDLVLPSFTRNETFSKWLNDSFLDLAHDLFHFMYTQSLEKRERERKKEISKSKACGQEE